MLKKILITLGIIILILLLAAGGLYLYFKPYTENVIQKLELTVDSVSVVRTFDSPEQATAFVELSAMNYLPFTVGVDSLVLRGTYNDTIYVMGLVNHPVSVKEGERVIFRSPIIVEHKKLQTLRKLADSLGGHKLNLEFMAYLDLPVIGKTSFPVNRSIDLTGGESPSFTITNIAVTVGEDFERADVNIYAKVGGKLNKEIVLDSLSYTLHIEGQKLIWGNKSDTLYPKFDLVLPATLALKRLREKLKAKAETAKNLTPVTIAGALQLSHGNILNKTPITFHLETMARLPIPPQITVNSVKLDDVTWGKAGLMVELKAINENPFGLTFKSLHYSLQINGEQFTETTITDGFRVGAHDTAFIDLPADIGWVDIGETAFNYIVGKTKIDYVFNADLDLVFDIEVLNKIKLRIHHSGQTDLKKIRQQQKETRKEERKERRETKRTAKNNNN